MQIDANNAAEAAAIDWVIRQRDPDFADWDGFSDWLAQAPGHADAYDRIASLDLDLDAMAIEPAAAPIAAPAPRRWPTRRAWFGGAMAAALVGAISLSGLDLFRDGQRIETAAGEHRTVKLADGSTITINGASVIELDKDRSRFARLESGEAMFQIIHRDDDPFVVETGGAQIVDLGTAFNIVRRAHQTSVAVSEGVVVFNPSRDNVRINAGQGIEASDGDRQPPKVQNVDPTSVGAWRTGLLVYNGAPLETVAQDLGRTAGIAISVAPDVAQLPFRGALIVAEDRGRTMADLAALSGTRAVRQGDGWILTR